jgi:uncharacterized membrane protein/uncharacterized protein YegL
MSITWTTPAALWLLVVVPLVWVALRFSRTNFNPRQRLVQAAIRSLVLAALALALARPVISTGSSRLSVVYLVDVSHSIASQSIVSAADRIDAIARDLKPNHSRLLAFGSTVAALDGTKALRALASADPTDPASPVKRDGTDLDRALREARAELAPGHLQRIVLFSDGRPTAGDATEATIALAAAGVRLFTEPMAPRDIGDTWIDRIGLPDAVPAGGLVSASVDVLSQQSGRALVELKLGDRVVASQAADLGIGVTTVPIDITFPEAGAQRLDAVVTRAGDPLGANNRLAREVLVSERPRVLYVEGAMPSAKYLQAALTQSGFDVTVRPPAGLPRQPAEFDPWDALIVSDVARAAMPDAAMKAMADWVEHDGGGLLIAGGEAVFGEGAPGTPPGYRFTDLERVAPTTFERKDKPEVALIIVLDKSWSMAGAVLELCKAAAQAAIDAMTDEQQVGLITFNDGMQWEFTLRNVGKNRDAIRKTIASIEASGHTLIYPPVEQAYLALKDARARAKHVVLLSDGRSYPDDYEGLVKKMVAAKITVSSIAVGPAADVELLSNIAKWGKGRSYIVEDAKEVPQIFVKEAKNAANPSFDEKALKPVVKFPGFLQGVNLAGAPSLRGRTATVTKDRAIEMMSTEDGDPLLSFWPIGLGRVAVFASDVKDRWATDWLRWKGYGPFFASIVHAIARQRSAGVGVDVAAGAASAGARPVGVTIEARDEHGRFVDRLKPNVIVRTADGKSVTRVARQALPGRYETMVVADASQALSITVDSVGAASMTRLVIPDTAAEYRFRPVDRPALEALAHATGGALGASADAIRRASEATSARRALWPFLVLVALTGFLVDILFRRIRILERVEN